MKKPNPRQALRQRLLAHRKRKAATAPACSTHEQAVALMIEARKQSKARDRRVAVRGSLSLGSMF